MAFIFGGNTPWTYDELQRQREIANALAMNTETPRNVGEGLNAIGNALAYRGITKRAGKEEARMKGEHDALRGTIFGGDGGMPSAPSGAPSGPAPAFVPPDPNSPGAVASDTMAALGKQVFTPGDKESFIKAMMPHAMKVSEVTGLDPRIVIAQAAQETGWGKSAPGNNFFGIKSHGKGGGNTFATNEVIDGKTVRINDSFRGYDSMGDSAMGYAEFLKENPRYGDMLAAPDLESQIAALGKSGYATDPNYAASVRAIATSIGLPEGYAPGQAQPQGGMDLGALLKFANDPMTSPGEKAIVEQLIAQQTQAADPMKAIELEKAQLELAQMKNPTADPMEAIRLKQAELDYQQDQAGGGAGATEYGTTLQFFNDPKDGKLRAGVIGKDGTFKEVPPPDGGDWATGIEKVDAGTKWVFINKRDGAIISEQPKDLRGAETEKAIGKAEGEAAGEAVTGLGNAMAKGDQALGLIDQIYNDPALPSILGIVQGNIPAGTPLVGGGQAGADLGAKIEQLQGQVFLEAFESLKGAGQITEIEGQKAERAKARLQRSQSPEAYKEALAELREVIEGGMKRAKDKAAGAASPKATASSGDFATMGIAEIGQVDIGSLTPEQMDALEERMTELGL